jgi:hypothetical protein
MDEERMRVMRMVRMRTMRRAAAVCGRRRRTESMLRIPMMAPRVGRVGGA